MDGPDTPTWTVDEAKRCIAALAVCVDAEVYTDVRRCLDPLVETARAHEHCGPAADTLRRARAELERLLDQARSSEETTDTGRILKRGLIVGYELALDLLVDGGGDG